MPSKTQKVKTPAIADQALDLLEKSYERNVSAVAAVSKRVADVLPELPAVPFADRLPTPETVVKTTFAVADRLLDIQREYALKLIAAVSPVRAKTVREVTPISA